MHLNANKIFGKVQRNLAHGYRRMRFPDFEKQLVYESGKIVSPIHRPPLPHRKYSWYSFLLQAESSPTAIVRTEGLRK